MEDVFAALSSKTRLRLLDILREEELACENPEDCTPENLVCDVSEIAERLGISAPSVSNHLKQLRHAGLIRTRRDGRRRFCSLNRERFDELVAHLETWLK